MSGSKSGWARALVIFAAVVMVGTVFSVVSQSTAATVVQTNVSPTVVSNPSTPAAPTPSTPGSSTPSGSASPSGAKGLEINKVLAASVKEKEQAILSAGGNLSNFHPPNLREGLPPKETGGVVTPLYDVAPAPMGVAYYGLSNTTGTIRGTTVNTTSIVGFWNTTDPTGTRATLTDTSSGNAAGSYGAQLNTVLVNVTLQGNTNFSSCSTSSPYCNDPTGCPTAGDYVALPGNVCPNEFWLQNYIQYSESSHSFTISGEIWNFSNPAADWSGPGVSTIEGFGMVEDAEVYQSPSSGTITLPAGPTQQEYTVALYFNYTQGPCRLDTGSGVGLGVPSCGTISTTEPVNELFLNYTVWNALGHKVCPTTIPTGRVCGEFDVVFFNSVGPSNPNGVPIVSKGPGGVTQAGSAQIQANGTAYDPVGLTNDFEFDYAIGSDDGATNFIVYTNGSVGVDYCTIANTVESASGAMSCGSGLNSLRSYSSVPAAYDFGGETGETSTGESVYWAPQGAPGPAPGESPVLGTSTPVAHMTTGPSLLVGLWNLTGSTVPGTPQPYTGISQSPYPAYTGGSPFSYAKIAPANAWVGLAQENLGPVAGSNVLVTSQEYFQVAPTFGTYSYWQGSGGDPHYTLLRANEYLPSGWYTLEVLLSGYNPVVEQIDVIGNTPVAPSITLTPNWATGAYTPDWAFSNGDLANLSVSPSNAVPNGAGTSGNPYVISAPAPDVSSVDGVVLGEVGSVSWLFSNVNDYLFTQWIGAYINSTTAVTQFYPAPSFPIFYPSWQFSTFELFNVPTVDGFQYYLLNTQNLAVIGATHIYAWGNSEATSIYSFVVNNGANDLIANNTFAISNRGLDFTGGGTSGAPTINGQVVTLALPPERNLVWKNTFVPSPQTSYTGLEPYTTQDSLTFGEYLDRAYNNYFAANGGDNATANAGAADTTWWNATCVPGYNALASGYYPGALVCEPSSYSQTLDGYSLKGTIVGSSYQGGNYWAIYGNNPNPYGNVPVKLRLTSETGTAEIASNAAGYAGDYAPLITATVYDVNFAELNLPSSTTASEFETGVYNSSTNYLWFNETQTTTPTGTCSGHPCVDFYLPNGAYTYHGYSSAAEAAAPSVGSFSVAGAPVGLEYTFSFGPSYAVTFTESGLVSGTPWTESVTGQPSVTSTAATHVFNLPNGGYNYQTTLPSGYTTTTSGYSGLFTVSGAALGESVPFYLLLTAPSAPTISSTTIDANQALSASGTIPTTGVPSYSWTWLVSVNGGSFLAATQCAVNSGSGASSGMAETCSVSPNTLTAGSTYSFELQVTDSAYSPETQTSASSSTVSVGSMLAPPGTPTVSATSIDADQALTVTGSIPTTGTAPYTWQWLVSVNGGSYGAASYCAMSSGSGASGGATETCSIAGNSLTAGDSFAFELQVTDSAETPETTTSPASPTVSVASELTTPGAPTVSATALDDDQALTVMGTIPTSGTSPYSWQWLVSVNGGAFGDATQCATNSGSGASSGATEICTVAANTLTVTYTYAFELQVTDSASIPEVVTSPASLTVSVASALTAPTTPTVSATALDEDQALKVTGTIPTTGTSPYSWQWLVSVNGASYGDASQCALSSGSGASGGSTETCSIASNTLAVGDNYAFELQVSDSASQAETATSSPSATVNVASALTAPSTPAVSATALDEDQVLVITGTIPTTGTSPYAWLWLVSVNGEAYGDATQCVANSGAGASGGSTVTCSIGSNTLNVGDTYTFELQVTDSASQAETATSSPSATVNVALALTAPSAPTVSATALDVDQALTVTGTIPTSGTPTYAWQWLVSVDGSSYGAANECSVSSGTGAAGGATVTCSVASNTLTIGDTYTFELEITDSATSAETQTSPASAAVTVASALTAPGTPTVSATALDADQTLTVTGTLPSSGTSPYAWQWLVSVNGGSYLDASQCSMSGGTGGTGGETVTCTVPGNTLTPGSSYAFELEVTDSASLAQSATSSPSTTLDVAAALAAPSPPSVSATALDLNQPLTVTGTIPTTGTSPYAWQWLISVNGGLYGDATQCATGSGTGATGGMTVTCSIAASKLTSGDTYAFELEVTDSASVSETRTSGPSSTVSVSSALSAPGKPTVNRPALDVNQVLTVSGKMPTTGSAPYSWMWQVSVNGGAYTSATQCAVNGGTGASAGATETCSIAANTLTAGNSYNFKLEVTDSATSAETKTSAASATVTVSSALTAPGAPSLSATKLDVDQSLTVTGTIPSTGTSPYAWEWLVSVNGGAYAEASICGVPSGSGASPGTVVTCFIAGNSLTVGDHYTFKLEVGDSATTGETQTSAASPKVTVSSKLTAPGAPTVSATTLPVTHVLTVATKIPTTGSGPYAWEWLVSVNGGGFVPATQCTVDSGTGAAGAAKITCTIPANTLTVGDTYTFELMVTDSATLAETQISAPSPTVTVVV